MSLKPSGPRTAPVCAAASVTTHNKFAIWIQLTPAYFTGRGYSSGARFSRNAVLDDFRFVNCTFENDGGHVYIDGGDLSLTPYAYTNYIAPSFGRGGIWRIPPQGTAELWLRDDLLSGTGSLAFLLPYPCGANGIGYFENAFYVANTERGLVIRIPRRR